MSSPLNREQGESDREMLAYNLYGCLCDIEHFLDQIREEVDEANTWLEKLSQ